MKVEEIMGRLIGWSLVAIENGQPSIAEIATRAVEWMDNADKKLRAARKLVGASRAFSDLQDEYTRNDLKKALKEFDVGIVS